MFIKVYWLIISTVLKVPEAYNFAKKKHRSFINLLILPEKFTYYDMDHEDKNSIMIKSYFSLGVGQCELWRSTYCFSQPRNEMSVQIMTNCCRYWSSCIPDKHPTDSHKFSHNFELIEDDFSLKGLTNQVLFRTEMYFFPLRTSYIFKGYQCL